MAATEVVGSIVPGEWPVPVNPPPTPEAHEIEARRAVQTKEAEGTATPADILYRDEWFFAVNKPSGRYCEVWSPTTRYQARTQSEVRQFRLCGVESGRAKGVSTALSSRAPGASSQARPRHFGGYAHIAPSRVYSPSRYN
eukprot:1175508-Prorocentrum_minimum.AAC.2